MTLSETPGAQFRGAFLLDPSVTFLNHGSFGACPRVLLDYQRDLRHRMEQQPVRFFLRTYFSLLDTARERLAEFIGASPESLAFVDNATTGINTVLRSLELEPGDELLTTDHDYPACRRALERVAAQRGASVVVAELPFPVESSSGDGAAAALVEAVLERVTDRTRLALIDWVTSFTGFILPIEELVRRLTHRGVETLVDGAHALAMLDVDLAQVRPTYFVANCHKWLSSPKGAAIIVVADHARARLQPLTISFGDSIPSDRRSRFHREFDWQGTTDPSAHLTAARAIDAIPKLAGCPWPEIRRRQHELVVYGRRRLLEAVGNAAPVPETWLGSMAAVPLPDGSARPSSGYLPSDPLYEALCERKFEVPVFHWPSSPRRWLRISAHLYNTLDEFDRLAATIGELLASPPPTAR